ncbi:MAG: MBL fold metallo-hydrolase [Pegethrix bostrychoides GSE-TBD4-15B]|jgi:L-ascorbate metabolism protein UlaG (beta-lactamase superfamily)|uniref:MBL fold metallo-hydrolase n=1 Tax=Pegethrix bostrychoides GSE-TBD4-15B TaxID=2839662 RepID=A0A951P7Z0_9CYAN|nr:MBL fold metallo-hydrolase [Pegethrix bostrychoides GSE-TBD4-15B]
MKRRELIYAGAGLLAGWGLSLVDREAQAQSGGLSVQYFGHSCFLLSGDGRRILVNPFRPGGCTAGYAAPQAAADLVMISSRLLDEGAVDGLVGSPRILFEPGVYELNGFQVQGIGMDHDDVKGRRFGVNVAWKWQQGGVNILHLGGAAAPITTEQQILMGRPDLLLLPVGGGAKAFTPEEARAAVLLLNPKLVVPTQYLTAAADPASCDILPVDSFLSLMSGIPNQQVGSSITLSASDLPSSSQIRVMSYS